MHRLGGGRRKIRIEQPARAVGWTMETIVLWSEPFRPTVSGTSDGSDDAGVAIAGRGRIGAVVTASQSESKRILAQLKGTLDDLERKAIADWKKERAAQPGGDPAALVLTPTHRGSPSDAAYSLVKAASPVRGRTYYLLDGEKLYFYGDEAIPDCKVNVSFEGVVVTTGDRRVVSEKLGAGAYAGYCGDRAGWTTPLATLEIDGKVLWILRISAEDGHDYGLFDPDANELVPLKEPWGLRSNR
jgi:hypothetical protein